MPVTHDFVKFYILFSQSKHSKLPLPPTWGVSFRAGRIMLQPHLGCVISVCIVYDDRIH